MRPSLISSHLLRQNCNKSDEAWEQENLILSFGSRSTTTKASFQRTDNFLIMWSCPHLLSSLGRVVLSLAIATPYLRRATPYLRRSTPYLSRAKLISRLCCIPLQDNVATLSKTKLSPCSLYYLRATTIAIMLLHHCALVLLWRKSPKLLRSVLLPLCARRCYALRCYAPCCGCGAAALLSYWLGTTGGALELWGSLSDKSAAITVWFELAYGGNHRRNHGGNHGESKVVRLR